MLHGKIIKVFAGFKGPTSKGKEGRRRERRNEGRKASSLPLPLPVSFPPLPTFLPSLPYP